MAEVRLFLEEAPQGSEPRALRSGSTRSPAHGARVTSAAQRERPAADGLALWFRGDFGEPACIPLDEGAVTIGAHPGNVISFDDPQASRHHCTVQLRDDGRLWVRDLRSRNGTWVDGLRVTEAELDAGAQLRIGGQNLRVERMRPEGVEGGLPGLLTADPGLRSALLLLRKAAPSKVPVLLQGESGSGKEVAARAVHELSPRAAEPFVPVNCGAISPELAEAELFGHERGAFTGAVTSSLGAFGAADRGTLFLDEIGDLPPPLQVKLLRALESGEVKAVGASKPRQIDVRIVCATHRDLRTLVRDGAFREDLYYRLCGLLVSLPPLRSRPLDVLPLAQKFLEEQAKEAGQVPPTLSADARDALLAYRWPGNVRELRHVVRLAAVMSEPGLIRPSALYFSGVAAEGARESAAEWSPCVGEPSIEAQRAALAQPARDVVDLRGKTLVQLEEAAIRASFERHRGNRRAMMQELGLAKSSLLRKLDLLGLRPKAPERAVSGPTPQGEP